MRRNRKNGDSERPAHQRRPALHSRIRITSSQALAMPTVPIAAQRASEKTGRGSSITIPPVRAAPEARANRTPAAPAR